MRTRIIVQLIGLLAVASFFYGFFDAQVTAFMTIQVKYGFALFLLVIVYALAIMYERKYQSLRNNSADHWEETHRLECEIARLHETIVKLKTKPVTKPKRKK